MEDYNTFIERRLSQMKRREEEDERRPSVSVIRFHGRPVLPPLLSRKQREEMQRYRDAKQKAAVCIKLSHDPRLARVQNLLHSVQLRTTPTLAELLQEPEIAARCLYSHNTSNDSVPQSDALSGTKESLSPPAREENSRVCLPPLTSTTYSAFFSSDRTTQQTQHEGCLIDQRDSQQESRPSSFNGASHQSLSSGYVTNMNVEMSDLSRKINAETESSCSDSSLGFFNVGGSSQHHTSSTIAKMPELISYPPMDGEELEKGSLEVSLCCNVRGIKDSCGTSSEKESATCDHFPSETSASGHLESAEHEENLPCGDYEKGEHLHEKESDISQTLDCKLSTTTQQQSSKELVPVLNQVEEADSRPSAEPHRLRLQALLKKSQEYRRRQRMLRSQAKNAKVHERTQEEPRARTEEQNLSDKENDEFSHTGAVTAEVKKTKERGGTFIPSVETSKKSWDNDKMMGGDLISEHAKDAADASAGEENKKELMSFKEGSAFRNNQLNVSQNLKTSHRQSSAFTQQQHASAPALNVHDAFYMTTGSTSFHKGPRKYHTVPVPQFCRSPTLKSKVKAAGGKPPHGYSTFSLPLNEDQQVEGVDLQHQNSHALSLSAVSLIVEGDITGFLAKSSQNIDQLESNLSILKVLISDLESTVKENLENRRQMESNTQSGQSFKSVTLRQRESDYWENKLRGEDGPPDGVQSESSGRQSLNQSRLMKVCEHLGPDLSFSDVENILLMYQEKGETINELRRKGGHQKSREAQRKTQHGGCQALTPPPQDISSTAQRACIPYMIPTAATQPDTPVLSDASNHSPVGKSPEVSVGGSESVCSPLSLSYDVDTPSGLWLHEGSGSSTSSQGHHVQENSLTPEGRVQGDDGASKVKRRLLMNMSGENTGEWRAAGANRSLRAAVHSREASGAQDDKQEQLKEIHAAQVSALQHQHRKQREGLLQALAERYHLLRSVSISCSMSSSLHLGDTLTSTPSMPSLQQHYRPLLAAAAKGFLTRRLLRTERVAQVVRTIRDTQKFLHSLQQQLSPAREFCSRQDLLLQERLCLQLRAARYEIHDVFFSLSVSQQMQMISWDRDLARERQCRRQGDHTGPARKSSLSAATQKSLERKRGVLIQKKAAEMNRMVRASTRLKTGISPEQLPETKRGQFIGNSTRRSKSPFSSGHQ